MSPQKKNTREPGKGRGRGRIRGRSRARGRRPNGPASRRSKKGRNTGGGEKDKDDGTTVRRRPSDVNGEASNTCCVFSHHYFWWGGFSTAGFFGALGGKGCVPAYLLDHHVALQPQPELKIGTPEGKGKRVPSTPTGRTIRRRKGREKAREFRAEDGATASSFEHV